MRSQNYFINILIAHPKIQNHIASCSKIINTFQCAILDIVTQQANSSSSQFNSFNFRFIGHTMMHLLM